MVSWSDKIEAACMHRSGRGATLIDLHQLLTLIGGEGSVYAKLYNQKNSSSVLVKRTVVNFVQKNYKPETRKRCFL